MKLHQTETPKEAEVVFILLNILKLIILLPGRNSSS